MRLSSIFGFVLVASLATLSLANISFAQGKKNVEVSGTWRYEYELEGQTRKDVLQLNASKDGVVTGTYVGVSEKPIELKAGKIEGDQLTLDLELTFQGIDVKVKYTGKVKDDDIVGEVIAKTREGDMPFDWVAKRSVEASDVVGNWDLEIDAGDRVLEPKIELALDGKVLKGKYLDSTGNVNVDLEKTTVEKNNLKFTVNVKMDIGDIKAEFSGRPYGNKIKGVVEYTLNGEQGQVEFSGTRKVPKKDEAKPAASGTKPVK